MSEGDVKPQVAEEAKPVETVEAESKANETQTEAPAEVPAAKPESTEENPAKADGDAEGNAEKEAEILAQVEFYFSDANLPTDKFLYMTAKANDGWVPISVIANFKRMRKYRPVEIVVSALRKSPKLLEVSDNGELVRRRIPLEAPNQQEKQEMLQRTVYAKGFGEETETTQEDIEAFFRQFGEINQVRLRRDDAKKFKSSVFAEFANLEDAKKFLELDPKPKYNGNELLTMSKPAYVEMKAAEYSFGKSQNQKPRNFKKKFNAFKEQEKSQYNHSGKRSRNKNQHGSNNKRQKKSESNEETEKESKQDSEKESKPETSAEAPAAPAAPAASEATESSA